jgi:hypothetical protein
MKASTLRYVPLRVPDVDARSGRDRVTAIRPTTNNETVKPMPPTIPSPTTIGHVVPCGNRPIPLLTANHVARLTDHLAPHATKQHDQEAGQRGDRKPAQRQVGGVEDGDHQFAPMSSAIARVSRDTRAAEGIRRPSRPRKPTAKAMSVAIGIPNPQPPHPGPRSRSRSGLARSCPQGSNDRNACRLRVTQMATHDLVLTPARPRRRSPSARR